MLLFYREKLEWVDLKRPYIFLNVILSSSILPSFLNCSFAEVSLEIELACIEPQGHKTAASCFPLQTFPEPSPQLSS